ncbi:L,D-transpeptidase family protein [Streptomyces sp. JHA26]|uniref:L,D-transpeptidase family protein n=1 Tax=Streptomyces sp. JHA26 TaxID=1917143 RepID=UPI00098B0679|nr:L,D-transpeptidase family protein [Streptomyces sp. JHA26]
MSVRKTLALASGAVICTGLLGTGCASRTPDGPPAQSASPRPAQSASPRPAPAGPTARPLPGLGPVMRARVPADTRQALVVRGPTSDANQAQVVLYERDPERGWQAVAGPWPAHNGLRGWTSDHSAGDLRTPVGVFGISDAGGRLPDPGTRLPYDQDPDFSATGTGHLGEDLEGSFDYVIAVDYNRVPGTTPLDNTRPLGEEKGGGVWIHVDHDGPTNACVSLEEEHMRTLLRALDPDRRPVVVMGPASELAR